MHFNTPTFSGEYSKTDEKEESSSLPKSFGQHIGRLSEVTGARAMALPVTRETIAVALSLSEELATGASKERLASFFRCRVEDMSDEEVTTLRARMSWLFSQLVAGILASPDAPPKRKKAERKEFVENTIGRLAWHDVVHAAVTLERNARSSKRNAVPEFIGSPEKLSEQSVRDEIMALLFTLGPGKSRPSLAKSDAPFAEVFNRYLEGTLRSIKNITVGQICGYRADAAYTECQRIVTDAYETVAKRIRENPGKDLIERAKRIYEAHKSGNERILVDEFLMMTASLKKEVE